MAKPRFLTKSRFKVGHECPTKLHYLDDPRFASDKLDDRFLKALADGGFQVGELAKLYHPGGVEIIERDHHKAAEETRNLLKQDKVVIFEAALMHENLFVKVDILIKVGTAVRLLEVKAKSWRDGDSFEKKKGGIASEWEEYVADIAFQRFVAKKAYPEFQFACALYLADKDKKATVSGIHQKFFLNQVNGRTVVEVLLGTKKEDLGTELLRVVPADVAIEIFVAQDFNGKTFESYVNHLSTLAASRAMEPAQIGRHCGNCEYRVDQGNLGGKSSGFLKCWTDATKLGKEALSEPMIFDIWNLHYTKKDKLISEQRYFMKEIVIDDIGPESDDSMELSAKQRQWLQIESFQNKERKPYFDIDHLNERARTERWIMPFHFIDFETLTAAIPFHKGLRPYETIAFQFSHHVIDRNGDVRHAAEYINVEPGVFPNFDFVRALMKTLSKDSGTVFRYAAHENTVLNHIRRQLIESNEADRDDLVKFIESLTIRKENKTIVHEGGRKMVDMLELVKKLYYSPLMGGSNSIKKVLPSVLAESQLLKDLYGKPTYGTANGIQSKNFKNKAWIVEVDGKILDPYKSLDPIFKDIDADLVEKIERVFADDEIKEGGAASTAYARMQFTRMNDVEREEIKKALLRYCELDTLAMVMIWQYWTKELIEQAKKTAFRNAL
jgi:hypothetical protein